MPRYVLLVMFRLYTVKGNADMILLMSSDKIGSKGLDMGNP